MAAADIADALAARFRETPSGVLSAYLFGSHASGMAHRESGVDVAVLLDWKVFPDARSRFEQRLLLPGRQSVPAGRLGRRCRWTH